MENLPGETTTSRRDSTAALEENVKEDFSDRISARAVGPKALP